MSESDNQHAILACQDTLWKLFDLLKNEEGEGAVVLETFYPVDLRKIIEEILDWEIEEYTDGILGFHGDRPIIGLCDFESQKIMVAQQDYKNSFTVAHEIGHVVLHKSKSSHWGGGMYPTDFLWPARIKATRPTDCTL